MRIVTMRNVGGICHPTRPWPLKFLVSRHLDFGQSEEWRPLTLRALLVAISQNLVTMMVWRVFYALWSAGFLDTKEGHRVCVSEQFRLDWWRVRRERRREAA